MVITCTTNSDHKVFKDPLPTYEQGDSSRSKEGAKINYTYFNNDNVIHMIEPTRSKSCNVIIIKDNHDKSKSANVLTQDQGNMTFKRVASFSTDQPASSNEQTSSKELANSMTKPSSS